MRLLGCLLACFACLPACLPACPTSPFRVDMTFTACRLRCTERSLELLALNLRGPVPRFAELFAKEVLEGRTSPLADEGGVRGGKGQAQHFVFAGHLGHGILEFVMKPNTVCSRPFARCEQNLRTGTAILAGLLNHADVESLLRTINSENPACAVTERSLHS